MTSLKKGNILVSYLVVAFNEERYIQSCLYSLLAQSYSNIELIFVDDGSEDDTFRIAEKLLKNQSRLNFKLIKFDSNKGKVNAFNKAFSCSKGEIITMLGADDIAPAMRTEIAINEIINKKIDYLFGSFKKFSNKEQLEIEKLSEHKEGELFYTNWIPGGTSFIKRSLALDIFPLPPEIPAEDWYIATKAIRKGIKPIHLKKNFLFYRIHEKNDSSIADKFKYMNQLKREIKVLDYILKNERIKNYQIKIKYSIKYRKIIIKFLENSTLKNFLICVKLFYTIKIVYAFL